MRRNREGLTELGATSLFILGLLLFVLVASAIAGNFLAVVMFLTFFIFALYQTDELYKGRARRNELVSRRVEGIDSRREGPPDLVTVPARDDIERNATFVRDPKKAPLLDPTLSGSRGITSAFLCYPSRKDHEFAALLKIHIDAHLESTRNPPSTRFELVSRGFRYKSICVAAYDVDAVFKTSAGLVHHERAEDARLFVWAVDQKELGDRLADFLGSVALKTIEDPRDPSIAALLEELSIQLHSFRGQVLHRIIEMHSTSQPYLGRNGRFYRKECAPRPRDVNLAATVGAILPISIAKWRIGETEYQGEFIEGGERVLYAIRSPLNVCSVCRSPSETARRIACESCGALAAEHGERFRHAVECNRCERRVCASCARYHRRGGVFLEIRCLRCLAKDASAPSAGWRSMPR